MYYTLSPENELVIRCARTTLTERDKSSINALIEQQLAWDDVLRVASWHRLSALLYIHLRRSESVDRIPTGILQQLEKVYYENLARNLRYKTELSKVLAILETAEIPTIILKGSAIGEPVYKDVGLRPMADLDIMVQEQHIDRAFDLVTGLGYSPPPVQSDLEIQENWKIDHHHYPVLVSPDGMVPIEIHRHIVPQASPLHFNIDEFWVRAGRTTVGESQALVLSPEELLIHLCLHCFRFLNNPSPRGGVLGMVCDISETVLHYRDTLDWQLLTHDARRYNIAGPIFCMLSAATEILEASLPIDVMRKLEPDYFDQDLERLFIDHWILDGRRSPILQFLKLGMRPTLSETTSSKWPWGFYLRRALKGFELALKSSLRPMELRRDLQIKRWVETVYGPS